MKVDPIGPWPTWRRVLWVALALVVVLLHGPSLVSSLRPAGNVIFDFFQEYASAKNVIEGHAVYTDQDTSALRYLGVLRSPEAKLWLAYNAHPPTSVLTVVPIAWLSYPNAFLVWNLICIAALAATIWIIVRELRLHFSVWAVLPIVTLLMFFSPFTRHLLFGQLSIIIGLIITGAWAAARNGKSYLAGGLVGLAATIKIFPAVLFLFFAGRRDWKALAAGGMAIVVLTLGTMALLGPQTYVDYAKYGLSQPGHYRSGWDNASIPGLFSKLFRPGEGNATETRAPGETVQVSLENPPVPAGDAPMRQPLGSGGDVIPLADAPTLAQAGSLIFSLAVIAWVAWLVWNANGRARFDLAFAMCAVAMLLITPIAWDHYWIILLFTAGIMLRRVPQPWLIECVFVTVVVMVITGVLSSVVPMLGLVFPLLAVLCIALAAASPWIAADRFPRTWVVCGLAAVTFASPAFFYQGVIAGGIAEGFAQPWQSLTVLSTHFYALVGVLTFGSVMYFVPTRRASKHGKEVLESPQVEIAAIFKGRETDTADEPPAEEHPLEAAASVSAEERADEAERQPAEPNEDETDPQPVPATIEAQTDPEPAEPSAETEDAAEPDEQHEEQPAEVAATADAVDEVPAEDAPTPATEPLSADAKPSEPATARPALESGISVFLVFQLVLLTAGVGYAALRYHAIESKHELPKLDPYREPIAIMPLYDDPHVVSDEDLTRIIRRIVPRHQGEKTPIHNIDHALRYLGPEVEFKDEPDALSGHRLRQILVDQQEFETLYGPKANPLLIDRPGGGVDVSVREHPYTTSSHVDHTLACLAEVGTPLDHPVWTRSGGTTVRAILEQSLRNFRLNQVEYEWSALSYVLYLPPETTEWYTEEGQRVSFDLLAERLMREDVPRGSCSAHHRMHALVAFLRVHEQHPILSQSVRDEVVRYLQGISKRLVDMQHADGYWNGIWTGRLRPGRSADGLDSLQNRILVTGHVLEWWALAPREVLPGGREPIRRAGNWLTKTLLDLDDQQISEYFSFLTHAGNALALWRGRRPADVHAEYLAAHQEEEAAEDEAEEETVAAAVQTPETPAKAPAQQDGATP